MITLRRAPIVGVLALATALVAQWGASGTSWSSTFDRAPASSHPKVLVLYPFPNDQSYVRERLASIYEAKKFPGITFTVLAAPSTANLDYFQDAIGVAADDGYKVLAINTGTPAAALVPTINKLVPHGLKVISFAGTAPRSLKITSDVNYSDYAASRVAGNEFKKLLPRGGQIGVVRCVAGNPDTDAFVNGFTAAIKGSNLKVVDEGDARCQSGLAAGIVEHMLIAHRSIVGIYDSVDVSAQGSLRAIQAAHSKAILGSIGGQEYALADIATGTSNWKFTVPDPYDKLGSETVDVAAQVALGKRVRARYLIPVQRIATASNAEKLLRTIKHEIAAGE